MLEREISSLKFLKRYVIASWISCGIGFSVPVSDSRIIFKWKAAYAPHKECSHMDIKCISDIENAGFKTIPAEVPGNFEIDLMNAGLLESIYYSVNTLKAQELENMDIWYYTVFETDYRSNSQR